jgi:predicted phosphodiesterase
MRIAILADVHGNLAALEAALAAVERLRPDRLVVAGDVVNGGPDSAACWERVKVLGCPVLRGNHERYVFDFGGERAAPEWSTSRFGPLQATVAALTAAQRAELSVLPLAWSEPEAPGLMVVHASARADRDSVLAYTPEDTLAAMFPGPALPPLIVRGHNHICATREWNGRRIVTAGSVGLPLDGNPIAQFTVLERRGDRWDVHHHAVPYDVEATLGRFRKTGYLDRCGPMGRLLMREVATGAPHLVPFLRFWARARHEAPALEQAVARFFDGM